MATLGYALERNARLYPEHLALIYGEQRLTYRALYERASRLASALANAGLKKQDRVSMLAMNCSAYLEYYAAAELSGIIAAPVNFRLAAAEIEYMLNDAMPSVLFFEKQYLGVIDGIRSRLHDIRLYVCIDSADLPSWAVHYEDLLASGSLEGAPFRATDEDILHLIYSSGTTGRPKGVMRTNRADAAMAEAMAGQLGTSLEARVLLMMPLFHIGSRSLQMPTFWMGGTVVLHRSFDPQAVLETIEAQRVTHTHMAPTMVQSLLQVPDLPRYDLSSLRLFLYAAAPMPVSVLRKAIQYMGPIFANGYGMTEGNATCLYPSQHYIDGTPAQQSRLGSVGQPVHHASIRIVDSQGVDCPCDEPGEIWLKSNTLFSGYWRNEAATREAFDDGWYKTGDMGRMDEQGFIYLVDRKKDMIITGGENVYCREVEEALMQHPDVYEAAVIGVPDSVWGESVKAVVVLKGGCPARPEIIIEHCRTLIARYKCPKSVEFVGELPRLPSGKISKVQLRAQYVPPHP
ncbi:class I adenylate-forming enzyme family protein [Herbaspirillum rubrisubalbicans]|uniref:class I adenylate-forming enzyme family protein n=1 Tax=Herbaspirillum rubrisubalbicans TaxID=80842 RepID=UPI001559B3B7|nr:long-chain-fatty-acid--CoA ligase [Herbaspirillum rubrisubalbicans]